MRWLLGPYTEARTYRVAAYLLVGLAFGVFEFTVLVTGFSLGVGLLVTIIGLPVLVATFLVARSLATMERRLARSWLDAPLPRRRLAQHEPNGFFWARLRSLTTTPRTWSEVAFLMLRLPMAVLDFTFITALISAILGGFAQPFLVAAGVDTRIGTWSIDTIAESLIFLPFSLVLLVVGARLILGWGELSRRMAAHFLGRLDATELKHEILDILARTEGADAFRILDELGLRLGHGSFLTPTRVEATLIALQSSGHVTVSRDGSRPVFAAA